MPNPEDEAPGLRIGFFGDGRWGLLSLRRLLDQPRLEVAFVALRHPVPDRELSELARERGVPIRSDEDVNAPATQAELDASSCDLFVSMSYDRIFHRDTFQLPRLGTINCHAGLLPFYRGRSVLNWVLINDEDEFGVTVHHVDESVDTGDIIIQSRHPITDEDDYGTLLERAAPACAELLEQAVLQIRDGQDERTPQSSIHSVGAYCTRRIEGDEILDWSWPSRDVFNFVRALTNPGPLARTRLDGEEWAIRRVRWVPDAPRYRGIAGAVLTITHHGFFVKTGDSFVEVTEWDGPRPPRPGDRFS